MKRNHLIAGAATIAALGGGAVGAIAASSDDKAAEKTVLTDAAKTLGVSAAELRSALANAEDAQVDAAVKAGKLTQAQADEIKKHRADEGTVLGFGHRGGPGHGGPGGPGGHFVIADLAKALGISEDSLFTQLRKGTSLSAIAKANGKTLADVKAAVKKSITEQLDADLKAGKITQSQYDEEIAEIDDHLDHLGDVGRFGGHDRGGPFGRHP